MSMSICIYVEHLLTQQMDVQASVLKQIEKDLERTFPVRELAYCLYLLVLVSTSTGADAVVFSYHVCASMSICVPMYRITRYSAVQRASKH